MSKRYFTPSEVNGLIPELEGIIRQLKSLETEIQEKIWRLKRTVVESRKQGDMPDEEHLAKAETEIEFLQIVAISQFDRVRELGGEVKNGFLVDFPALIYGQEVVLCLKPGEQEVRWYHGEHEGIGGRKPIPSEMLGEAEEGE